MTKYDSDVVASRVHRDTLIQAAEAACTEAVAPLALKLKNDILNLGEEPLDGPRFSRESEIWWTYQHARAALSRAYGNAAGVHETRNGKPRGRTGLPSTVRVAVAEGTAKGHQATHEGGLQSLPRRFRAR